MATTDDRFDKLEKLMQEGFQKQRLELGADIDTRFQEMRLELGADIDARFQEMRVELRTEMTAGFDNMSQRFEMIDRRFDTIDRRFEMLDHRFDTIDRRFEMIDHRFAMIDQRLDSLSLELVALRKDSREWTLQLANFTYLIDQSHSSQGKRLISLEQRVDRIESANPRPSGQL